MKRILKLLLPAFFATGAFAFNITPFLTCVAYDPAAGMTTAYFGYESFEQSIITIPVGSDNRIIPDPPNRNQPTLFFPGYFEKAFRVTFSASSAVFLSFNGFAIPANSNSAACPATTNTAPTPAGQSPLTIQATDGITTSQHTYSWLIANGVTIDDAVSTRAPGFTPQFRVVTTVAATITAAAACDTTEFVVTGGGACTVPNSNTVMGRIAASEPVSNAWQVTCSGGTATAVAVSGKQ